MESFLFELIGCIDLSSVTNRLLIYMDFFYATVMEKVKLFHKVHNIFIRTNLFKFHISLLG